MSSATRRLPFLCFASILMACVAPAYSDERQSELLVFAAASLTDVLAEIVPAYERQSNARVKLSFAASSVLARQIEAGGRADIFISADQEWMDYLQARALIDKGSRRDVAGNRLVLVASADSKLDLKIVPGFRLAELLGKGRLSTGDPDTVPVGRYARSALTTLGLWDELQHRLVRADNVRSALMFVARGEAPLGIVYATDAAVDPKVRIVDTFPADSHPPITYPAARVRDARADAAAFLDFLGRDTARGAWRKFGFVELSR